MKVPTKFTGIHDYLNEIFGGIDPTDTEIALAKKVYWRAYNTDFKRRMRASSSSIHIRLEKEDIKQLQSALSEGQEIAHLVRDILVQYISKGQSNQPVINTALIEQQLFLINEYLQELLLLEKIDEQRLQQLEDYILAIEKALI
ncbi:hypothetical protein [uncultured Dokdonia sp.]|uniref:hypothetical protein n=1 Tax=uncultured Dokdonia sp. TaxID=575653 RepID=UPI00262410DF|nr:hypothetical protein [uncultured Dokdonia sp.]